MQRRAKSARLARWRQPTQVLTGFILTPASLNDQSDFAIRRAQLVLEDAVWLNIDLRTGQLGSKTGVLPLFADGQRELEVWNENTN